jgi:Surface-adhesin protein E
VRKECADIGQEQHFLNKAISMRIAILAILLAVVSGNAAAAWVTVSGTNNFFTFADPATISKAGNMVKMWDLLDYKIIREVEGIRYLSQKSHSEYNCQEALARPLVVFLHSGIMGSGEPVFNSNTPDDWQRVSPGTVNEALLKYACGTQ